jgi:uncharacterized protein (TIGR03435 family)
VRNVSAQSPATAKRFDVASVKPALSPAEAGAAAARAMAEGKPAPPVLFGSRLLPGGRFQSASPLKQLVAEAFEVKDFQVEGGPKWLASDFFSINATAGSDATPADVNTMLKQLLVDRFALRTHIDTRHAPVYVLTVARSDGRLGTGLKPTSPECLQQIEALSGAPAPRPAVPPGSRGSATPTCGGTVMYFGATGGTSTRILSGGGELTFLISTISGEVAAPVIDRTGLTGRFDVTLDYTSQRQSIIRPGLDPDSNDTPAPPIGVALEKQLGLKLEKQTGPLPFIVIDAAERPTAD